MSKKVWLVTGCSKGLGNALVNELIEQGYNVVATSRNKGSLEKSISKENDHFLPVSLDITNEENVKSVVKQVMDKFGRIDCLVNNAGFTYWGIVEEMTDVAARECFDVNFFGLLNMLRNVLPIMREQKSGLIFNTSSLGAYSVGAISGVYCATKHAVKAISETLTLEVQGFGINVVDVKPGFFRTEFLNSSYKLDDVDNSPYQNIKDKTLRFYFEQNHHQIGDPKKAAKVLIKVSKMDNPPKNLPLGSDSSQGIIDICQETIKEVENIKELSYETDFDK